MSSEAKHKKPNIRTIRTWRLLGNHRHLQFLRASLIGLLAGALAVAFQSSLWLAESLRDHLLSFAKSIHPGGWLLLIPACAAAGGVAGYLTQRYAREASGSGIPHVKAVLLHIRHITWERLLPVKFIGGVLAIGAGFSLGREGPTVQMGAAVGRMVCAILRVPRRSRSQLIAAGAGAGLAAAFNAPLAGFIFAIEELQREMSPLTYGTALIAAVIGDAVTRSVTGQLPSFHISGYPTPPLASLPLFAILGAVCGLVGVAFNHTLLRAVRAFHSLSQPMWMKAAAVGAVVAVAALVVPAAIGGGHSTAEAILKGQSASLAGGGSIIAFLMILFVAKFALTVLCYASGVPGGIFAPLLVLGAVTGALVGRIGGLWWPAVAHTPAAFAVVGMAAAFAAIVRAPLTGVVLILEMTGNYQQMFALLVASVMAYIVADHLHSRPVYEALLDYDLKRQGKHLEHSEEPTVINVSVDAGSRLDGTRIREVGLPKGALFVSVDRAGTQIAPYADLELKAGDNIEVLVAGDHSEMVSFIQDKATSVEV